MGLIVAKGVAQCCDATVGCGPVVPTSARTILIFPGQTEIIDEAPYLDYLAIQWLVDITVITTSDQRSLAYEIYATHDTGTPSYTLYGGIGQPIAHTPTVSIVGANLRFSITNNSVGDVYLATTTRIPVVSSSIVAQLTSGTINPLSVPFQYFSYTVPATSTQIIDTLPLTQYTASKWIIKVTDTLTGDVRSVEVYGNQRLTGSAVHTTHSGVGTLSEFNIDSNITSNDFELSIDNLKAHSIDVSLTRIPITLNPQHLCCVCDCGSIDVIPITDVLIPSSATITIDAVTAASVLSTKWLVVIENTITNEVQAYQVHATHDNSVAYYNVYAMVGDIITTNTTVSLNAGNLEIDITNLESDVISINVSRIQVVP